MTCRHLHVACAIIESDGLVMAAQRSATMSLPLKWEFPGGKINSGETPEQCLKRELQEELDITIDVHRRLTSYTHRYPDITVTLYPYICSIVSGNAELREHADLLWLRPAELMSLDWAEADRPVLDEYCLVMQKL